MTWSPQPLTHWTATSLRKLLRELAGTLPDVLGLDEAAGFISVVGQHRQPDQHRLQAQSDRTSAEQITGGPCLGRPEAANRT